MKTDVKLVCMIRCRLWSWWSTIIVIVFTENWLWTSQQVHFQTNCSDSLDADREWLLNLYAWCTTEGNRNFENKRGRFVCLCLIYLPSCLMSVNEHLMMCVQLFAYQFQFHSCVCSHQCPTKTTNRWVWWTQWAHNDNLLVYYTRVIATGLLMGSFQMYKHTVVIYTILTRITSKFRLNGLLQDVFEMDYKLKQSQISYIFIYLIKNNTK